jgi:exonuclease VII large subunit
MALETSAEAPVPVRTVMQAVSGWIGKLGRIWVEGQIAECTKRGNTVFLTLRDPIAAVSARVICTRAVFDVRQAGFQRHPRLVRAYRGRDPRGRDRRAARAA